MAASKTEPPSNITRYLSRHRKISCLSCCGDLPERSGSLSSELIEVMDAGDERPVLTQDLYGRGDDWPIPGRSSFWDVGPSRCSMVRASRLARLHRDSGAVRALSKKRPTA